MTARTTLSPEDLADLDQAVERLLLTGHRDELTIIGAGEITCVLEWRGFACKRLPPFKDLARVEAYRRLVERYVTELRAVGIPVVDTALQSIARDAGYSAYIVQPRLPADWFLPPRLRAASLTEALELLRPILDHVQACQAASVGIDAQLSNWSIKDGRPMLLDVTTPLLRDESGRDLLDTEIFVATLPVVARGLVRRFLIADLLDRFYDRRGVFLDLISNMANYGLVHFTEPFLAEVNARLDRPLTMKDVLGYRRQEWWTWKAIRACLKMEQIWRRKVLRVRDPHLLPSQFEGTL